MRRDLCIRSSFSTAGGTRKMPNRFIKKKARKLQPPDQTMIARMPIICIPSCSPPPFTKNRHYLQY